MGPNFHQGLRGRKQGHVSAGFNRECSGGGNFILSALTLGRPEPSSDQVTKEPDFWALVPSYSQLKCVKLIVHVLPPNPVVKG